MKKLQIFIIFCVFSTFCYSQTTRPVVSNISAAYSSTHKGVLLSWTIPEEAKQSIKEILIFRKEGQFITSSMIAELKAIATISPLEQTFIDLVHTKGNYYYAIVAITKDKELYSVIIPTMNATTRPITINNKTEYSIPAKERTTKEESSLREKPLANLQLFGTSNKNESIELPQSIIDSTKDIIDTDLKNEILMPTFLTDNNTQLTKTQDDAQLNEIINSFLENREWLTLKKDLEEFIKTERTEHAKHKALFYLGQIAYLQKDYRLAIFYFQYAKDCYPAETMKWIDSSLLLLETK